MDAASEGTHDLEYVRSPYGRSEYEEEDEGLRILKAKVYYHGISCLLFKRYHCEEAKVITAYPHYSNLVKAA